MLNFHDWLDNKIHEEISASDADQIQKVFQDIKRVQTTKPVNAPKPPLDPRLKLAINKTNLDSNQKKVIEKLAQGLSWSHSENLLNSKNQISIIMVETEAPWGLLLRGPKPRLWSHIWD